MARRDGDIFTDMLEGAFWTSAAIFTNAGPRGCLVAFILLIWFIVIPGWALTMMNESPDGSIEGWIGAIVLLLWITSILVSLHKLHIGSKKQEDKSKQLSQRRERLLSKYEEVVKDWIPTHREQEWMKDPDLSAEIVARFWKSRMAQMLADGQTEWELAHQWDGPPWDLEWEAWLQRNQDMWVRYRLSILYNRYIEITDYWLLNLDDLLYNDRKRNEWSQYQILFKRDFDKHREDARKIICENLAYDHASREYKAGCLLPVFGVARRRRQYQEDGVIPPPTVQQQKEWRLEDESTQQKSGRLSYKEKQDLIN